MSRANSSTNSIPPPLVPARCINCDAPIDGWERMLGRAAVTEQRSMSIERRFVLRGDHVCRYCGAGDVELRLAG